MFKNLIIKKNLVQKIYFRLLSLVLVIIVLSVGIFLYKTNFNRSSITIYDQSIPVSSNLDKLEVPKDLNPENSKTSEYNFSSPHLIILNNKKIGIADRVDLNQLGFESGINQLKISKVEKVFENLYKVGRPKIWEINIDKIKPEVKTTLPSKLIFQESDITLEIEVSEQGQLISKNLLSDQFLVSGKNQVKFQLTESNQKIDFEYRDLAGNTVSQNITLKNQLNSNLASLACPNFKFWYDKSRLINNWERLTYFDYKTATYPDSPLNTASLATYNILNDRKSTDPLMNIDNAKCQFVINPLTSTFYGNTGGDASRPYIRIFQDSESTDDFVANRVGIVQDCDQWKREELSNYYKLKGVLETKYCKSIGSAGYGLQNTTLRIITFQSKGLTYRISSPRADVIAPKFSQYIQENDLKDIFEFLNEV